MSASVHEGTFNLDAAWDWSTRTTKVELHCPECGRRDHLELDTMHPEIEVRLICVPCDWQLVLSWRSRA